ncbi:hypothetical protein SLEP1_g18146 [Rubroshorea leprosula]|uniref:Uncharacterized protein n=1 Tax=Rubroshorea leprosula TaxID=152421 RepID=A0AAV5IWJ4_9ROSI|nr:hypothetical protein SLEP1_g18146 [Rubroshorea leprosula]
MLVLRNQRNLISAQGTCRPALQPRINTLHVEAVLAPFQLPEPLAVGDFVEAYRTVWRDICFGMAIAENETRQTVVAPHLKCLCPKPDDEDDDCDGDGVLPPGCRCHRAAELGDEFEVVLHDILISLLLIYEKCNSQFDHLGPYKLPKIEKKAV